MPDQLDSAHPDQIFNWSEPEELRAYQIMLLIRRFEEKAGQLYALGKIFSLDPLSIGQEAVAAGLALAAGPLCIMIAGPRPHGLMLASGVPPGPLMAALLSGDPQDRSRLDGPVLPASGSPALTLSKVAAACGREHAAVWCVGEGAGAGETDALIKVIAHAASQGPPILFVIENTGFDVPDAGLCTAKPSALFELCAEAGIKTSQVNGLDVRSVKAAAQEALSHVRHDARVNGGSCVVLEILTYRYKGHANTPGHCVRIERPREETDPVAKARARIAAAGGASTEARLKGIEQSVRSEVSAALDWARKGLDMAQTRSV
ncbi:MAG: thiamine pyrophosphate-dependent enzyme [Hyphomicrobium sp.]